jgi:hypothetical protein
MNDLYQAFKLALENIVLYSKRIVHNTLFYYSIVANAICAFIEGVFLMELSTPTAFD